MATILSFAMPSYPRLITLEDGICIYLKGDENCKWGETLDGYTILPKDNTWVYAKASEQGYAEPTDLIVRREYSNETKKFLATQKHKIPINYETTVCRHSLNYMSIDSLPRKTQSIVGERRALVILMAFSDLDFRKENKDFDNLFNKIGYCEDNAIGSVKDYFQWSSYGQLNFSCDVIGPFTASHPMSYYGKNMGSGGRDKNPFALFEEALHHASNTVDLAQYDSNCDGYIDNIHIIFAGYGEESGAKSDAIWSHEMTFPAIDAGGVRIDRYSCAPELRGNSGSGISRIGPHCHEMGHALGAMDYYDVDYSNNGNYPGTGEWDIMASGSWNNEGITPPDFNPYVKIYDFGWAQPQSLDEGYNEIYLSCEASDRIFLLPTPAKDDFYLIENRQKVGFDAGIPGEGLVIFHVGPEINSRIQDNSINSHFPQQCYVVCASSEAQVPSDIPSSYGDINSPGCSYPGFNGNREFSESSIPAAICFNNTMSGLCLTDISEMGDTITLLNRTPSTPIYIWKEDFETSDWRQNWTQVNDYWKHTMPEDNNNIFSKDPVSNTNPIKHDSNYLYSKYATSLNNNIILRKVETSSIHFEEGKAYRLNLEYYNSPQIVNQGTNRNILSIYLRLDNSRVIPIATLGDTGHEWKKTEIEIKL